MGLDEQATILRMAEEHGREQLVVLLGSPDPKSARVHAETVTQGDPAWSGPLAGVPLGLAVYHILEDEVRAEVDPSVYRDQAALIEMAIDKESIVAAVRNCREAVP
jgi:glycine/sarcosine/betaine reductase complex component A